MIHILCTEDSMTLYHKPRLCGRLCDIFKNEMTKFFEQPAFQSS